MRYIGEISGTRTDYSHALMWSAMMNNPTLTIGLGRRLALRDTLAAGQRHGTGRLSLSTEYWMEV